MPVLFVDTALAATSVAVLDATGVLFAETVPMERGHQEHLAPRVIEGLRRAGVSSREIRRVGVVVGPGSFTGIRVGIAFAKGFALGIGVPCVGITTLEALALSLPESGRGLVAMDGGRGEVFLQLFTDRRPAADPERISAHDLRERALELGPVCAAVGSAAAGLGLAGPARFHPDPAAAASRILEAHAPFRSPAPVYLRAPDARTLAERGLS